MTYVRASIGHVYAMQRMLEHVTSKLSPEKKGEMPGLCGMDYIAAIAISLFYSTSPGVFLQYHLESLAVALASSYQPGDLQWNLYPVSAMTSVPATGNRFTPNVYSRTEKTPWSAFLTLLIADQECDRNKMSLSLFFFFNYHTFSNALHSS